MTLSPELQKALCWVLYTTAAVFIVGLVAGVCNILYIAREAKKQDRGFEKFREKVRQRIEGGASRFPNRWKGGAA